MHPSTSRADESATTRIRVLVADDHPIVRSGVVMELAQHEDIHVVAEATNGDDVLRQLRAQPADVVILDINMPNTCTLDVLRQIGSLATPPHVIIFTAHNDAEHILPVLKAGAKGYMLKDERPDVVATAVRAVARGQAWLSASVVTCVINHGAQTPDANPLSCLSEREAEVLEQLIEGKDNQEIGDALYISERTVRFHLRNIYDKVGVRRRGEAIAWGIRTYMPYKQGSAGVFAIRA